ncbi:hypothetical protein OO013_06970 [Mangrovivirga sp. M17]|uniref:Uncharacterized protein n=1 Tax=Mangrovivirga halotolerans TaxID=2993936 RepID=A0ABT3RP91_9BACT|nr:hypothetical protein [Mangrovivirga halotolerans]MCX2743599.1 hypothetical protein [Mangrovivirga halotolerans]
MRFRNWDKKITHTPPEKSFPVAELKWMDGSKPGFIRLFTRHLEIERRNEKHLHELKGLHGIQIVKGHYLGFIWAGGVLSSLSMVALFTYYDHPLLMISLFFVGIMLIYIGGMGGPAIQLNEPKNRTLVLLKKKPVDFQKFIRAFYAIKSQSLTDVDSLWLPLTDQELAELEEEDQVEIKGRRELLVNPQRNGPEQVLIDWPVKDVLISMKGNKLDIAVKDFKLRKTQVKQRVYSARS